jgi:hypothetical protein
MYCIIWCALSVLISLFPRLFPPSLHLPHKKTLKGAYESTYCEQPGHLTCATTPTALLSLPYSLGSRSRHRIQQCACPQGTHHPRTKVPGWTSSALSRLLGPDNGCRGRGWGLAANASFAALLLCCTISCEQSMQVAKSSSAKTLMSTPAVAALVRSFSSFSISSS